MKKEEVYVEIDSKEKRLRALDILEKAGEKVYNLTWQYLKYHTRDKDWFTADEEHIEGLIEITLDQLEQLLIPMSEIEQLKQQAEKLGYELVEKKRVPKVGDFGVLSNSDGCRIYDFIFEIRHDKFVNSDGNTWDYFRHLTDEEKQQIQNNW